MDNKYDYKISYSMDDNGYYEFNKIHLLTTKTGKKVLQNHRFSIPVFSLILVGFITLLRFDIKLIIIELIAMVIMDAIWILCSDKIYFRKMKKGIAKLKKDGNLPYDKSGELVFDSDGYTDISKDSVIKRTYSSIEKIILTEKTVYLYTSATNADIINCDVFKDENEKSGFLSYIASKAPDANIIRK